MACPSCGSKLKRLTVHDEQPFRYSECTECSWDDYELQYHLFRLSLAASYDDDDQELNFEGDNDELEQDC